MRPSLVVNTTRLARIDKVETLKSFVRRKKESALGESLIEHLERRHSTFAATGLLGRVCRRTRRWGRRRRGRFAVIVARFVALGHFLDTRAALSSLATARGACRCVLGTVVVRSRRRMRRWDDRIVVVRVRESTASFAGGSSRHCLPGTFGALRDDEDDRDVVSDV